MVPTKEEPEIEASGDEDETTSSLKEEEGEAAVTFAQEGGDGDDDDGKDDGEASEQEEFIEDEVAVARPRLRWLKMGRDERPPPVSLGPRSRGWR